VERGIVKALTVRQPWAWALIHGGKDVENRTQAWSYRGPLAIHAGMALFEKHNLASEAHRAAHGTETPTDIKFGGIIGVVDLVDVHVSARGREVTSRSRPGHGLESHRLPDCCSSPWAQFAEGATKPVVHLVVENPRPLARPIAARGQLGLWTPYADTLAAIREQVPA
jgi:hypothetical protein